MKELHKPTTEIPISSYDSGTRHDFSVEEVSKLFALPFNDLMFKAAEINRQFHNPNAVQISTLLSIKTGSCPENCKYCPQSAHYTTGLEKESLMAIDKILEAANAAKEGGASRFCMGAAWRNLHDRDVEKICHIVDEVKNRPRNLHDSRHVNRLAKQETQGSGSRLLQSQHRHFARILFRNYYDKKI